MSQNVLHYIHHHRVYFNPFMVPWIKVSWSYHLITFQIKRLGDALAVLRWGGTGSLLVVSNLGKDQADVQLSRIPGLPTTMTVAISSAGSSFSSGSHINLEKTVKLGPGETVLLAGAPRHCGGPGPVDKIANKLSEGWQKLNKYFSNV